MKHGSCCYSIQCTGTFSSLTFCLMVFLCAYFSLTNINYSCVHLRYGCCDCPGTIIWKDCHICIPVSSVITNACAGCQISCTSAALMWCCRWSYEEPYLMVVFVYRKGGRGIRQNVDESKEGNGVMICATLVNTHTAFDQLHWANRSI